VSVRIEFPSTFIIKVFQPPEPRHFSPHEGQAVARTLLYDDIDHDGHRSPSEPLMGEAPDVVIADIGPGAKTPHFPDTTLPDGFSLLRTPLRCLRYRFERFDCHPSIGEPCTQDADCCPNGDCDGASAVCYTDENALRPVPGGYCTFRVGSNQCDLLMEGEEAMRLVAHRLVVFGANTLFRACTADAECRPGYHCEPAHRICFPKGVVQLVLETGYAPDSICQECQAAPFNQDCAESGRR
jgi:hypothetical protein